MPNYGLNKRWHFIFAKSNNILDLRLPLHFIGIHPKYPPSFFSIIKDMITLSFCSCWSLHEYENNLLWKGKEFCVETTIGDIKSSFKNDEMIDNIFFRKINYLDYDKDSMQCIEKIKDLDTITNTDILNAIIEPIFSKDKAYSSEYEVRLMIDIRYVAEVSLTCLNQEYDVFEELYEYFTHCVTLNEIPISIIWHFERNHLFNEKHIFNIDIDPLRLIQKIIYNPNPGNEWFVQYIKNTLSKFGVENKLEPSRIASEEIHTAFFYN